MPEKRINSIIKGLPFEKKMLGVGAVLLIGGSFLPWYQDLDMFRTGDLFIGVNGPLYLIGFTVLALSVLSLTMIMLEGAGKKLPLIKVNPAKMGFYSGLAIFYHLLLANTIYFSPKFGLNLTMKESQFGMFMALIGAGLMTVGGFLAMRQKSALIKEFQEAAKQEAPVVSADAVSRKPKENLRNMAENKVIEMEQEIIPVQQFAMDTVAMGAGESNQDQNNESQPEKNYQPFRTDL